MILTKEVEHLSDTGKMYFKRIQASLQRMNLLTDDILSYSQLDTEGETLGSVNLNNTLKFVRNTLSEEIARKNAVIKSDMLPSITGYRTLLSQLFQNIISNALKFQEGEATPEIRISATYVNSSGLKYKELIDDTDYVCISFADNGIGFERKYVDRIFQMFQRLHTGDKYSGTGIGLAICKKIVELHRGYITAESTPGGGSAFHCYLPLHLE
jgi:signal transduction histidine kinase